MFANISRIAVALLVVAFVPARVPADVIRGHGYDAVSDLYSTTDHKFVGSFRYTPQIGIQSRAKVWLDQPFNFGLKYRHVTADLYRFEDVMPGCVTVGEALGHAEGETMNVYDGNVRGLANNGIHMSTLTASFIRGDEHCIFDRVVVMYAQNQDNDEYSPIACGRIRDVGSTDNFMEELNSKPILPPVPTNTKTNEVPVLKDGKTILTPILTKSNMISTSVPEVVEPSWQPLPPLVIDFASNSSKVSTKNETGSPSGPKNVEAASPSGSTDVEATPLRVQAGSESLSTPVPEDSTKTPTLTPKNAEAFGVHVFMAAEITSPPLLIEYESTSSTVPTGVEVSTGVKATSPSVLTDAEPTSPPIYQYVSDLYAATDRRFVGSFNYSLEAASNVVNVQVGNSLHFASKYPYVAIMLYRPEDVLPGCRPVGPALVDQHDKPLVIYSGKDTGILNNSDYSIILLTSLVPERKYPIANSIVVMYSANAEDPKPTPIACGKIGDNTSADDFFEDYSNKVSLPKPTDLPSPSNPVSSLDALSQIEAVTDLYSAKTGRFAGLVAYQTFDEVSLKVVGLSLEKLSNNGTAVAVVYRANDVMPGCVTTGPAVVVRDERSGTRLLTLFNDRFELFAKSVYGNVVDYASVRPRSNFDIMGHVVVVYALESESSAVLDDFLQLTNPHTPIACGAIRSADASEDNFLQWAPAGVKPIVISETRKWTTIASSIAQSYKHLSAVYQ